MHKREKFEIVVRILKSSATKYIVVYKLVLVYFSYGSLGWVRERASKQASEGENDRDGACISGRASNDNNNSNHYVEQHIKFKVA